MAGPITMLELTKRLNRLESQQVIVNKTVKDLGSRFAWFWYNDRVKIFCIITALKGAKASLVGFSEGLSGGLLIENDVELFVYNPLLEKDEQDREGKWESILDLSLIIDEVVKTAVAAAEKAAPKAPEVEEADAGDDSATDTEAATAA